MSTYIKPGNGKTWDETFPNMTNQDAADLNSALLLLSAWLTRGRVNIPAKKRTRIWVVEAILSACTAPHGEIEVYTPDNPRSMEELGRLTYWIFKALDTDPEVGRG